MVKILLGCTGSVACVKVGEVIEFLKRIKNSEIRVVVTKNAKHFYNFNTLSVKVYEDKDEWTWSKMGDKVLHIELRSWADVFVIAPLDANTLGKLSSGICDNLVTCIARAWKIGEPLIFCPAMNSFMWDHPCTKSSVDTLASWGYIQVPPIRKVLACGDEGIGAMAKPETIFQV
uniref:Flavoprotein domain-containing protein n=1 Tax=Ciona savignyi TaxID=51511 RepID=H2Z3Z9_CIOSA